MASGESKFIGYVGDPDFHDGSIVRVHQEDNHVRVIVKGASGQHWSIEFRGVKSMKANCPEGMRLYALSELKAEGSARHFVFANWDEIGSAHLEIVATDYALGCAMEDQS